MGLWQIVLRTFQGAQTSKFVPGPQSGATAEADSGVPRSKAELCTILKDPHRCKCLAIAAASPAVKSINPPFGCACISKTHFLWVTGLTRFRFILHVEACSDTSRGILVLQDWGCLLTVLRAAATADEHARRQPALAFCLFESQGAGSSRCKKRAAQGSRGSRHLGPRMERSRRTRLQHGACIPGHHGGGAADDPGSQRGSCPRIRRRPTGRDPV